jgi:EAL and modified HD-GYP domain-containing signal transduction protein
MTINAEYLITRQPIVDRNYEIAFTQLSMATPEQDIVMPFMLRLANIEIPQSVYFVPLVWVEDTVLFNKLARDMILVTSADSMGDPKIQLARESGFRIAAMLEEGNAYKTGSDFTIIPIRSSAMPSPDTIYTGIESEEDMTKAKAMYLSGPYFYGQVPASGGKRINPSHALILELISAVQQEAEPKDIESLLKRDVTLSFKLLRFINSPGFGLATQVESVRHALSIMGYQQLQKWLSLLAVTAGQDGSPVLTQTAMIRAKLMELLGAKLLDKRESDNLFVTGMLSLLDRMMGVPMEDILRYVNLAPGVTEALLQSEGRYLRYLQLAQACEGTPLPEDAQYADIDTKIVNIAHLEAIEWASQVSKI